MAESSRLRVAQERNFVDFVSETVSEYFQDGSYQETLVDEVAQAILESKIFPNQPPYAEIGLRVLDCYVWNVVEKMGANGNWIFFFVCPDWNSETRVKKYCEKFIQVTQNLKKNIFFDLGFSFSSKSLEELSQTALSRYLLKKTVKSSPLNGVWKERVSVAMNLYNDLETRIEQSVQLFCLSINCSKKMALLSSDLESMGICVDEHIEAMILDYYFAMMVRDYLKKGPQSRMTNLKEHMELKVIRDFSWVLPSDQIEWLLNWARQREGLGQTVSENPMDYSALSYWIGQAKKPVKNLS